MKIWLFAGGGQAEITAFPPFFERLFPRCQIERKTPPIWKPGPKPRQLKNNEKGPPLGMTGDHLAREVSKRLEESLKFQESCDLILVLDDLDCHPPEQRRQRLWQAVQNVSSAQKIPLVIGLVVPELEAWILADWDNAFAKDDKFKRVSSAMRHLASELGLNFTQPESFGTWDADNKSCKDKMSELLQQAAGNLGLRFSKTEDTPRLLRRIDPTTVAGKCPHFSSLYQGLASHCTPKPLELPR